jgi:O-antigen/teichoic acid export membrane protein
MSTAKRVIKNTGYLYAKMGITMFISLYTTRLVLNSLGASDFGIFSIVGGAIAMLAFLDASMAAATQRFMSYAEGEGNKEKQKKIFNISFVLHFFLALLLGGILLVSGYFFFNGILNIKADRIYAAKVVYASLIISTVFTVMTVPYDAVLNARENMLYYAIVGIIESLLKLGVALAVVYLAGDKLVLYGVLMAIVPLVVMITMRVYCHRKYDECVIAPKKYWDKKLLKEMGGFAGWSLFGASSGLIGNYGSSLLLNHFFGTVVNAAQGIVVQLNGQILVLCNNLIKALNPVILKKQGEGDQSSMMYYSLIG